MVSEVPRWQEVSAFWLSAREKYRKRDETGVKFEAGRGRKTLQGTKAGLQNRKRQNSSCIPDPPGESDVVKALEKNTCKSLSLTHSVVLLET